MSHNMDELLCLSSAAGAPATALFGADANIVATTATPGIGWPSQLLQHHIRDSVGHDDVSPKMFIRQDSLIIWLLNFWILKIQDDSFLLQVWKIPSQ